MKISTKSACRPLIGTENKSVDMAGGTIIHSRCPVFALTTALSCVLTAGLLLFQRSWNWCGALMAIAAWMGVWQTRIVFCSPILVIHGPIATLYREGEATSIFMLSDLTIVQGNLTTGLAFLATALIGVALGAIGLSPNLEVSMSLSLSPTQRLLLIMSGLWFSGAAGSIAYLDFPRRKLLLDSDSDRPQVIFIASRKQRHQLLLFLKALKLEAVMQKIGLGDDGSARKNYKTHLPDSHGNERIRGDSGLDQITR